MPGAAADGATALVMLQLVMLLLLLAPLLAPVRLLLALRCKPSLLPFVPVGLLGIAAAAAAALVMLQLVLMLLLVDMLLLLPRDDLCCLAADAVGAAMVWLRDREVTERWDALGPAEEFDGRGCFFDMVELGGRSAVVSWLGGEDWGIMWVGAECACCSCDAFVVFVQVVPLAARRLSRSGNRRRNVRLPRLALDCCDVVLMAGAGAGGGSISFPSVCSCSREGQGVMSRRLLLVDRAICRPVRGSTGSGS